MKWILIFIFLGAAAFGQNAYGPDYLNLHCTTPDSSANPAFGETPRPGLAPSTSANGNVVMYCDAASNSLKASYSGGAYASLAGIGPVLDKGGQVFNVKAYGAIGNGSTDDSTTIAAAITAAITSGGGLVYFPPSSGNYEICTGSVPLTLPSNVYLWIPVGVTLQACSTMPVATNMITTVNWPTLSGTTNVATAPLNFGIFGGGTIDGNTSGRGTMSYYVTQPGTNTAGASMVTTTATFTPSAGSFGVTGLAAGQILSVQSCSVAAYNQVSWTIATVSSASITATSKPSGTTGLAAATGCVIANKHQGNVLAFHGYQSTLNNIHVINAPNGGEFTEWFTSGTQVRQATLQYSIEWSGNANFGLDCAGPTDSQFFDSRAHDNGFEGSIFEILLNNGTQSNGCEGSHLIAFHPFHNGRTGAPGYDIEADTTLYGTEVETGNAGFSGGLWLNGNDASCGSVQFNGFTSYTGTGDGITFSNCTGGDFTAFPTIISNLDVHQKVNGLNFTALTPNFKGITVSSGAFYGNSGTDIIWPSGATTAASSSITVSQYGTTSGTQPTSLTFQSPTLSQYNGLNRGVGVCGPELNSAYGPQGTVSGTGAAVAMVNCSLPAWCASSGHKVKFSTQFTHTALDSGAAGTLTATNGSTAISCTTCFTHEPYTGTPTIIIGNGTAINASTNGNTNGGIGFYTVSSCASTSACTLSSNFVGTTGTYQFQIGNPVAWNMYYGGVAGTQLNGLNTPITGQLFWRGEVIFNSTSSILFELDPMFSGAFGVSMPGGNAVLPSFSVSTGATVNLSLVENAPATDQVTFKGIEVECY